MSTLETTQVNGRKGRKILHRTKSEDLAGIFTAGLNDGSVVIVDGLKYHLHGNKLIIDKNAAKSADIGGKYYESVIISNDELLKGKPYAPSQGDEVILLNNMAKSEVIRRVELVDKLVEYGIKLENINFHAFEEYLSQITWSEKLQKKMDILKLKRYAPSVLYHVVLLNNMTESEVLKRVLYADDIGLHQHELYGGFTNFTDLYIP